MGQKNSDTYKACSFFFLWNKKKFEFFVFFSQQNLQIFFEKNIFFPKILNFFFSKNFIKKMKSEYFKTFKLKYIA